VWLGAAAVCAGALGFAADVLGFVGVFLSCWLPANAGTAITSRIRTDFRRKFSFLLIQFIAVSSSLPNLLT
jgi:hypothetical protein